MYAQHNGMGGGFPMVPGHEIIGKVAAVGDGVTTYKEGDRIGAGWHGGHDGTCQACKKGFLQMCSSPVVNGETQQGGYGEYVLIQAKAAVRVPAHVDAAKYAPMLCAGVTAFNALRKMDIPAGETVAVQGLGGVGHMAIQYANRLGYRVVAISRDGSKEEVARELGAHDYVDASKGDVGEQLQKLGGARLIIVTAPTAEVAGPLLGAWQASFLLGKGLSVQCWPGGHNGDSEDAIVFTERHNVDCVIEKFPLSKANEAYSAMLSGNVRFKGVLVME
ncbi:Alcohol dehydrogenase [Cytospora mali]|uniref:Alcohol dehydrogenase n=1 Tax=Cytospora mali TaxID=578113 RepID=A0A194VPT2_CYTMA|nr:Alcohol dehydrogenase [Valsa mali]